MGATATPFEDRALQGFVSQKTSMDATEENTGAEQKWRMSQWHCRFGPMMRYAPVPLGFSDIELPSYKALASFEPLVRYAWPAAEIDANTAESSTGWKLSELGAPLSRYGAELAERAEEAGKICQAYARRIEELRSFAADDDDCPDVSEMSKTDFWSFVRSMPGAGQAGLFLLDNGNLRAVWKNDDGEHLGIQFLGDRSGEFVVFNRRKNTEKISRASGIDTLRGIKELCRAFGLTLLENG